MIRNFMGYQPPPEELARMELHRLPADKRGFRLDISSPVIREALDDWKREQKMPIGDPLSDQQRKDFEYWFLLRKFSSQEE